VAQYRNAFQAFRKLFPLVTQFASWDETNFYGEATYDKEALVVGYYQAMQQACPNCTILAAEFLDVPKSEGVPMTTWARTFIKLAGGQPQFWGLNNYEGRQPPRQHEHAAAAGRRERQHLACRDGRNRQPHRRQGSGLSAETPPRGEG